MSVMDTLILCAASFLAGGLAVCVRFEKGSGPFVRAAEEAAKAFAMNRADLVERMQTMSKEAYRRRKL